MNDNTKNISISSGTIFRFILICILFYFLYIIRDIILVLLTSIVIASAIEPATRWLGKRRIPRLPAVMMIYTTIILILSVIFYIFVPPLINDIKNLQTLLPQYLSSIGDVEKLSQLPFFDLFFSRFADSLNDGALVTQLTSSFSGATFSFLTAASGIFGGILSFVLIIVISFYLAVQENGVVSFLRLITPIQHEKYVVDLWARSQRKIGLWMQGQLLLGLIVGLLTYLGLSILGVENPMFLALIAAVMELIPIFGPILAAIPAVGFSLIDGGLYLALWTAGLYVIIQQFESQLIHPLVVRKIVGIPALIAIIALIIGSQIAGFLGIILSVPIAAALMEYIGDVEREKKKQLEKLELK